MTRKIGVEEAREYFAHPSQHVAGTHPDKLPEVGFEYWADEGLCGAFHGAMWPGVAMGHYGAKVDHWGRLTGPAKRILRAFSEEHGVGLIIGWTDEKNRAAISFARRIGFVEHGRMELPDTTIIEQSWRP